MNGRWFMVACLMVLAITAPPASAADVWTTPSPGIQRLRRTTASQHINVLVVDLCKAGVSLRTTAYAERGRTVASFGALVGAQAVINGDFFGSGYSTDGIAMHAGAPWGGSDHAYVAPVAIGSKRIEISHHNNTLGVQPWMTEVVSGHPTLLDDSTLVGNNGDPLCTNRHPRTAIGITQDHSKLILAVVDGRATNRIGMTCTELANLLKEFGAFDAVNMDGGGSSSMWLSGIGVVNYPSDGASRVVGNHLAVYAKGTGAAPQCPCEAHCSGTKIYGNDCGVGDCGVYGSTCVDDSLGARCVFALCPAIGEKTVCVDESTVGSCDNGAVAAETCTAGESCVDEGTGASCAPGKSNPDAPNDTSNPANPDVEGGCAVAPTASQGLCLALVLMFIGGFTRGRARSSLSRVRTWRSQTVRRRADGAP